MIHYKKALKPVVLNIFQPKHGMYLFSPERAIASQHGTTPCVQMKHTGQPSPEGALIFSLNYINPKHIFRHTQPGKL